jgi:hypothetical protein
LQDYKGLQVCSIISPGLLLGNEPPTFQDIIAILGMDELSEEDKLTVERARKIQVSTEIGA